jgi:hypothetical protein
MSSRGKIVAVDVVGGEQKGVVRERVLSETHTLRVVFRDFANLPHGRGAFNASSVLLCHGYEWQIALFPGGYDATTFNSSNRRTHISTYLRCVSADRDGCISKAKFAFRIPSVNHSNVCAEFLFHGSGNGVHTPNFISRDDVLNPALGYLVDGNLTIEVDIQVYKDASPFWEPQNELNLDMMKILKSADQSGDVTFIVGSEKFSAHRLILETRAPELATLANGYPPDTPVPIQDIKPSTFQSLLRFVYANDVPNPRNLKMRPVSY